MTMSRVKCTVHRCHGQPSTRATACLSPSCWSVIARRTPDSPRRLRRTEELDPEAAGLDLADIEADHLSDPALVHRIGDDQRLGHDSAVVADLDVLGIEPQIRVGALQRPLAKRGDPLVQPAADRRDAVLGHPRDPELLDEPVDLPSRDPVDVGLHHDRDDRLLRRPPRLQERREVRRTGPLARDQQLDLPDPRLPPPRPIPVAMRRPRLRARPHRAQRRSPLRSRPPSAPARPAPPPRARSPPGDHRAPAATTSATVVML